MDTHGDDDGRGAPITRGEDEKEDRSHIETGCGKFCCFAPTIPRGGALQKASVYALETRQVAKVTSKTKRKTVIRERKGSLLALLAKGRLPLEVLLLEVAATVSILVAFVIVSSHKKTMDDGNSSS